MILLRINNLTVLPVVATGITNVAGVMTIAPTGCRNRITLLVILLILRMGCGINEQGLHNFTTAVRADSGHGACGHTGCRLTRGLNIVVSLSVQFALGRATEGTGHGRHTGGSLPVVRKLARNFFAAVFILARLRCTGCSSRSFQHVRTVTSLSVLGTANTHAQLIAGRIRICMLAVLVGYRGFTHHTGIAGGTSPIRTLRMGRQLTGGVATHRTDRQRGTGGYRPLVIIGLGDRLATYITIVVLTGGAFGMRRFGVDLDVHVAAAAMIGAAGLGLGVAEVMAQGLLSFLVAPQAIHTSSTGGFKLSTTPVLSKMLASTLDIGATLTGVACTSELVVFCPGRISVTQRSHILGLHCHSTTINALLTCSRARHSTNGSHSRDLNNVVFVSRTAGRSAASSLTGVIHTRMLYLAILNVLMAQRIQSLLFNDDNVTRSTMRAFSQAGLSTGGRLGFVSHLVLVVGGIQALGNSLIQTTGSTDLTLKAFGATSCFPSDFSLVFLMPCQNCLNSNIRVLRITDGALASLFTIRGTSCGNCIFLIVVRDKCKFIVLSMTAVFTLYLLITLNSTGGRRDGFPFAHFMRLLRIDLRHITVCTILTVLACRQTRGSTSRRLSRNFYQLCMPVLGRQSFINSSTTLLAYLDVGTRFCTDQKHHFIRVIQLDALEGICIDHGDLMIAGRRDLYRVGLTTVSTLLLLIANLTAIRHYRVANIDIVVARCRNCHLCVITTALARAVFVSLIALRRTPGGYSSTLLDHMAESGLNHLGHQLRTAGITMRAFSQAVFGTGGGNSRITHHIVMCTFSISYFFFTGITAVLGSTGAVGNLVADRIEYLINTLTTDLTVVFRGACLGTGGIDSHRIVTGHMLVRTHPLAVVVGVGTLAFSKLRLGIAAIGILQLGRGDRDLNIGKGGIRLRRLVMNRLRTTCNRHTASTGRVNVSTAFSRVDVRTRGIHLAIDQNGSIHQISFSTGICLARSICDRTHDTVASTGIFTPLILVIDKEIVSAFQNAGCTFIDIDLCTRKQYDILPNGNRATAMDINRNIAVDRQIVFLRIHICTANIHRDTIHAQRAISINDQSVTRTVIALHHIARDQVKHGILAGNKIY